MAYWCIIVYVLYFRRILAYIMFQIEHHYFVVDLYYSNSFCFVVTFKAPSTKKLTEKCLLGETKTESKVSKSYF